MANDTHRHARQWPSQRRPGLVSLGLSAVGVMATAAVAVDYPSSVVGTDFDFIRGDDPSSFQALKFLGSTTAEMPDKRDDAADLFQPAFLFEATFSDAVVKIFVDAGFANDRHAAEEARRYCGPLGRLPAPLRRGVRRLVVHRGGPDTTAFSDVGLIVVYSDNATRRIATHDLEETIFHESVHAAWDAEHAASRGWRNAQLADDAFVTVYAAKKPAREDLAESALFAFAMLRHPDRIDEPDRSAIAKRIPHRIAYIADLLSPGNDTPPEAPKPEE